MDDNFERTDQVISVSRDEVPRDTSLAALAELEPVAREDGLHTAGTSSQIMTVLHCVDDECAQSTRTGPKPLITIEPQHSWAASGLLLEVPFQQPRKCCNKPI